MNTCGNCGKSVGSGDTTCPHCGALLAAWTPAAEIAESPGHTQPDYARPPTKPKAPLATDTVADNAAATSLVPTNQIPDHTTAANVVNIVHAMEKSTTERLVRTIQLYARKREAEAKRTHSPANRQRDTASHRRNQSPQISNMAFAVGTFLIVFLLIMWGIVAVMVIDDMVSIEFLIITIVLTIAFKPTMDTFRRASSR